MRKLFNNIILNNIFANILYNKKVIKVGVIHLQMGYKLKVIIVIGTMVIKQIVIVRIRVEHIKIIEHIEVIRHIMVIKHKLTEVIKHIELKVRHKKLKVIEHIGLMAIERKRLIITKLVIRQMVIKQLNEQ